MKTNRLRWFLLFLLGSAVFQLPGQQTEADRKLLADVRAKAQKGDAQSQYELGSAFDDGSLGVAKDYVEAVKWYRKAAEQNDAQAQSNLGACYGLGRGVAKDEAEAVKWYRKAAEQNYAKAQFNLGACYGLGEGVAKDYVEAVKWFRKAAEQNYALAQYSLGSCYELGDGVAKDYVEAYKWCLLAAGQGDEDAKKDMSTLEGRMTREQIAEGQKLARSFKPREVPASGGRDYSFERPIPAQIPHATPADDRRTFTRHSSQAAEGMVYPQFLLGLDYWYGHGTATNRELALHWMQKAATAGSPEAKGFLRTNSPAPPSPDERAR